MWQEKGLWIISMFQEESSYDGGLMNSPFNAILTEEGR